MSVTIETVSPRDPQAVGLLEQSHALMRKMFAPEDNHFLGLDALCVPAISLYLAAYGGQAVGCVALMRAEGYGEVKSFFVDPGARGRGVGQALLAHLEGVARGEGLTWLRLETGTGLDAAARLYRSRGFLPSGPFGAYEESPASLFFEKSLDQDR
ncbi:GNAT family N-acetyltransferase [Puniceibacterium sediminis]|uniref:Putative acetyltransferase n=1 Tax=Puniceibacterium sediminis TaxID=1608407 RepID=A0A238Y4X2_9RHOB|nr:GNAT family N-acetyltransferase [Puniceibacterium sediminis]SNR66245.1 putative acetyltransferase [Puniceibacterium sediminis]